jgi:hypothetical protein
VVLHDDRRGGAVIELVEIRGRLVPAFLPILDVQADQMIVRRFEVQPFAEHGDPSIR